MNFKKDRLLVNYDYTTSNNQAQIDANGFGFVSSDKSKNKLNRNDIAFNYQKRFDDYKKQLDFKFNVNSNDDTHYLHYGHMSIFSKKSNLDLYIKNLKFLIFKIKNNEEIHNNNNKSFYIDESLEKKFIDTGKKFQ